MWLVLIVNAYLALDAPIVHPSCPEVIRVLFLYHLTEPALTPEVRLAALPTEVILSTDPPAKRDGVKISPVPDVQFGVYELLSLL